MQALIDMETIINGEMDGVEQRARLLTLALRGQDTRSPEEAGLIERALLDIVNDIQTVRTQLQTKHQEAWKEVQERV